MGQNRTLDKDVRFFLLNSKIVKLTNVYSIENQNITGLLRAEPLTRRSKDPPRALFSRTSPDLSTERNM